MEQDPTKAVRQHQDDTARLGEQQAARVQVWQEEFGDEPGQKPRLVPQPTPRAPWWAFWRYG